MFYVLYKNCVNMDVGGVNRVGRQGTLLCKEINIGYL